MPVRICVWNLYMFTNSRILQTHYANNLLDYLHPVGGQAFDVIAIIEPRNSQSVPPGNVADGAGTLGILTLVTRLQARHPGWRIAPPLSMALGTKSETIGLFYDSDNIELVGPNTDGGIPLLFDYAVDPTGAIFWLDTSVNTIHNADAAAGAITDLATGAGASDLAIDGDAETLYWSDLASHEIWQSQFDGTGAAAIVTAVDASSLQIDHLFQKLYWIQDGTLRRSDLDGQNIEDIIGDNLDPVRSYAIDPTYDRIYWSGNAKIQHCNLDGNKDTNLVAGLSTPVNLRLDMQREFIYWVDTGTDLIQRLDPRLPIGAAVTLVTAPAVPRDLHIDIHHGKMYWRNTNTNSIWRADLDGAHAAAIVAGELPLQIAIDPSRNRLYWTVAAGGGAIHYSHLDGTQINPPVFEEIALASGPTHILPYRGGVYTGQCNFDDAFGNAVVFPVSTERRPILFQLRDKRVAAPNNEFMLLVFHAPKPNYGPNQNSRAQDAAREIPNIREITTLRAGVPVVVAGDFNCCPVPNLTAPGCNFNQAGHGVGDAAALGTISAPLGMGYTHQVSHSPSSISPPGVNAPYNDFKNHAYDNLFSIGFAAVANAAVDDPITVDATALGLAQVVPVALAALPHPQFQGVHERYYKDNYFVTPIVQETGLSDHLPVKIDVTL